MNRNNQLSGVAIVGTRARGGIYAVIENHIQAGVYEGYEHYFIASHDEVGIVNRVILALTSLFTLISLIIRGKISVCHLHGSMKGSIYRKSTFVFVCRLLGCKVIFHLHGSEFAKTYEKRGGIYKRLVRYVLNQSDNVFVLSDYWKTYVETISVNTEIHVINNFPAPVYETLYDTREYSKKSTTELLFLGYIGQRKGIYDLVEAVALLKARGIEGFHINVGGNGEVDKLKALVAERDLTQYFNVIGWVSGDQKHQLLKQSDLLLLPSHNEGLPIAILEAMSAGLAVLSTRVGGIPDAISDERYGLLVEPGKPEDLANAISRYLDTKGLIESVTRNARELYDEVYSAQANVAKIRTVIDRLKHKRKKKVLAVASKGGHSIQLMRLKPVLDQYDTSYVSSQHYDGMDNFTRVTDANRNSKFRLMLLFFQVLWIVIRKRPNIVISSGAAPGYFTVLCGKLLGAKTIWIDSIANAEELSMSGQRAGKFADLWLTQWPEVAHENGPKYGGRVL